MLTPPEWLKPILINEGLPSSFGDLVQQHFLPIAERIATWHQGKPLVIGINGAQGTGKSTLSLILAHALLEEHGKSATVISIDDIYHTKAKRAQLAEDIHPLLATRGVPGTHDVALGAAIIQSLENGLPTFIPSFNKAADDRRPEEQWMPVESPVDIIIFEGWCIGARPQKDSDLTTAVNDLEEEEDQDSLWRQHVNEALQSRYTELFSLIDKLIMIKAPSMECIYQWRSEQELKLQAKLSPGDASSGIMNDKQLKHFIMHYERLTRWMLDEMPERADVLIELNTNHTIYKTAGIG